MKRFVSLAGALLLAGALMACGAGQDGESALRAVDTFAPNLILLDLMLPGICLLYTSDAADE